MEYAAYGSLKDMLKICRNHVLMSALPLRVIENHMTHSIVSSTIDGLHDSSALTGSHDSGVLTTVDGSHDPENHMTHSGVSTTVDGSHEPENHMTHSGVSTTVDGSHEPENHMTHSGVSTTVDGSSFKSSNKDIQEYESLSDVIHNDHDFFPMINYIETPNQLYHNDLCLFAVQILLGLEHLEKQKVFVCTCVVYVCMHSCMCVVLMKLQIINNYNYYRLFIVILVLGIF